jgi:hypothetical protein
MHCVCCVCSRTITCQTAVDARGVGVSCNSFRSLVDSKTPHLASAQVGRVVPLPNPVMAGRTLGSTSSIASPCTDQLSRQPVSRRPLFLALPAIADANGGRISHARASC